MEARGQCNGAFYYFCILCVNLLMECRVDVKLFVVFLLEVCVLAAERLVFLGLPIDNFFPFLVGFGHVF